MTPRFSVFLSILVVFTVVTHAQTNYWVQTSGPGSTYDVRSFTTTSTGTLFAGTWTDGTVWKTTNDGSTWTQCGPIPNPNPVVSLCTLPNDHIMASVWLNGIARSTDGGASWQMKISGLTDFSVRQMVVDDSAYVWVATQSGLFSSADEGSTWSLRLQGAFSHAYLDSTHAIMSDDGAYTYRSLTHGRTWTKAAMTPAVGVLGVHPDGSYYASTGTSAIYRSSDLGVSWTDMHSGVNWSGYTDAFTFSAAGKIYYGRDAAGMLYSADSGKTWLNLNNGLTTNRVIPLFRHPDGYIFVGTNGAGVFRSAVRPDSPPRVLISVSPLACSFGRVRVGMRDTLTLQVTNFGTADTLKISPVTSTNPRFAAAPPTLIVPPQGTRALGVVYTPTRAAVDTGTLLVTGNDPASPLVAVPLSGEGYALSEAPTIVSITLVPNTYYTARIVWLKSVEDTAGAVDPATEYSLWRRVTTGGSTVWEFMASVPAIGLSQYALDQSLPYVYNSGAGWWTFMVAVRTQGLHTYYSLPDSILDPPLTGVSAASGSGAPGAVTLRQNYPNPFNPATTIEYGLPHAARVTLIVYNTLGQEVARLVDAVQEAGYHRATFDGTALPSGMYFCRLAAGSFVRTSRMLLLR
ncbi:MAG TPA: T9SS type A sorting domain-containing protein [Bacteroidota bacterium]|nr:T9SS type A sorting domain-containing protein [Bacteroidota bacterium]